VLFFPDEQYVPISTRIRTASADRDVQPSPLGGLVQRTPAPQSQMAIANRSALQTHIPSSCELYNARGWVVASRKESRYRWAGARTDLDGVDDRDALV